MLSLVGCILVNNSAAMYGGAIMLKGGSELHIFGCAIMTNSAQGRQGQSVRVQGYSKLHVGATTLLGSSRKRVNERALGLVHNVHG